MNKIVLYTVITGNYDKLKEIPFKYYRPNERDYICFTDNSSLKSKTYKIINIDLIDNDAYLTQKYYKAVISKYIENYDYSIYIDGKIQLKKNIFKGIKYLHKDYEIVGFCHPKRNCIYSEANIVIHPCKNLETIDNIKEYIQKIKNENFPKNFGLIECSCLIRKHSLQLKNCMNEWYNIIKTYSKRDQLSFMYCIWKFNIKIKILKNSEYDFYLNILEHIKVRKRFNNKHEKIGSWIKCYNIYRDKYYYWNIKTKMCKWKLNYTKLIKLKNIID